MSDIFISYARSTAAQAQLVAETLRGLGYAVWRDDELPAHRSYAEVIEERLQSAKVVVVVWSAEAVKSEWVQSEADTARTERKLVQLTVDGAKLPRPFDRIQCADMIGWTGDVDAPGWKKVAASVADLMSGGAPTEIAAEPQPAARKLSICVLPFANMSGDPEQEYFSDGISEDIITDLSKVSALYVIARNTAFTFKGKAIEVPEVTRRLGVSHVLEGSVRKAGNRVRITAQLIEEAGGHIWAERYDRELDDIFALQDEISQAIVAALKVKLLPEEKKAIESRGTGNAEAYELYLMAREEMLTGNVGDARLEEAVIRFCERAVEIDPNYANAWALMASAQLILALNRGRGGEAGLAAAETAQALDPNLGGPHAVKARLLYRDGNREAAFEELDRALALEPDAPEVIDSAGLLYQYEQRLEDAAHAFERGVEAKPNDPGMPGMLISLRTALNDRDGAREAARMTLGRAEAVLAKDRNNGFAMSFGVTALMTLGDRDRAKQWINRALLVDPDNLLTRYNFACAYALHLKDYDAAIDLMKEVFARDGGHLVYGADKDPDLDGLRRDPRFQQMLADARARLAKAEPSTASA